MGQPHLCRDCGKLLQESDPLDDMLSVFVGETPEGHLGPGRCEECWTKVSLPWMIERVAPGTRMSQYYIQICQWRHFPKDITDPDDLRQETMIPTSLSSDIDVHILHYLNDDDLPKMEYDGSTGLDNVSWLISENDRIEYLKLNQKRKHMLEEIRKSKEEI